MRALACLQKFSVRGIIANMERDFSSKISFFDPTACRLCPVECGANRLTGAGGCGVSEIKIAKYYLHPFEEPCISFKKGSGTIFFTGCSLRCVFCQNYELSRAKRGKTLTPQELADVFKELEEMGAENISLVTAGHLIPYLLPAFDIYQPKIPVVYNSSGYEKIESIRAIDDVVDIYLPDMKFYSSALSKRYTGRENYFDVASETVAFMAQKPLKMTKEGKMLSGTIVRHLVMPMAMSDSRAIIKWFARELPKTTYLSLMSQYTPFGETQKYPELNRGVTAREYAAVLETAKELGIENLFVQELQSKGEKFIPKWDF